MRSFSFCRGLLVSVCLLSSFAYTEVMCDPDPMPMPMENGSVCLDPADPVASGIMGDWIIDLESSIAVDPAFELMPPELVSLAIFGFRPVDPSRGSLLFTELAKNNYCALIVGEISFAMMGSDTRIFALVKGDAGYQMILSNEKDNPEYNPIKFYSIEGQDRLHVGIGLPEQIILKRNLGSMMDLM